jgi:hypothetical protein
MKLEEILKEYVERNIQVFHSKRLSALDSLVLDKVLKKKNPYLFKAKNILTADLFIESILSAYLSSSEETIFGDWLEQLAIHINSKVYNGKKSTANGIDLEFDKDNIRYLVSIKSGPNWGNSSQIKKLVIDFNSAKKSLKTSGSGIVVECVNGCCYGQESNPIKTEGYYKYCGQAFWEFISGSKNLYTEIIEPLGANAKQRNEEFNEAYAAKKNLFVKSFVEKYCFSDGRIDWEKLLAFNSGRIEKI